MIRTNIRAIGIDCKKTEPFFLTFFFLVIRTLKVTGNRSFTTPIRMGLDRYIDQATGPVVPAHEAFIALALSPMREGFCFPAPYFFAICSRRGRIEKPGIAFLQKRQ